MPRGPGQAKNYNLDYSRWHGRGAWDEDAQEDVDAPLDPREAEMRDALRRMPPELQEAFRLQQLANQSGDPAAKARAGELALRSVQNGSPEVQREFLRNIQQHDPEVAKQLEKEMPTATLASPQDSLKGLDGTIKSLRSKMEQGAEDTKQQLEVLTRQQDRLGRLTTPEDMLKFMHEEGDMSPEDMQRIFAGDQMHMEQKVREVLDKACKSAARKDRGEGEADEFERESETALREAEYLHKTLVAGENLSDAEARELLEKRPVTAISPSSVNGRRLEAEADAPAKHQAAKPRKEKLNTEPDIIIPAYRLKYVKDEESGRYTAVELCCSLPCVTSMSMIALDVSEKHMRLTTESPAPRYAVNAGPFPVLLEPGAARAKFSRKREELTVVVPAAGQAARA